MNKKIKKAAAIMAAAVLCLSMSMTVFASDAGNYASPDAGDIPTADDQGTDTEVEDKVYQLWYPAEGKDEDGKTITVRSEMISKDVEEILKDTDQVKEILTDSGYDVPENAQVVVLGAGDYKITGANKEISGSVEMEFRLGGGDSYYGYGTENWAELKDIKDGDIIYVLHQKDDGTWEVLEGKAVIEWNGTGYTGVYVKVAMTSFSPVAFIKVMSDGQVVVLDKNENPVSQVVTNADKAGSSASKVTTTTVETKKSPKTGE